MITPSTHPKGRSLLSEVKEVISTKTIFGALKNRRIIFVCGGPIKPRSQSKRKKFIQFAKDNLPHFRIFLAEKAIEDFLDNNPPQHIDLTFYENLVAKIADGIVIFPESAGSIAELGFFSNAEENIYNKILIVNDVNEQGTSFINIGPVYKIEKSSIFRKTIYLDPKSPDFTPVKNILEFKLRAKTRKSVSIGPYNELGTAEKLFFTYEIISIFGVLSFDGLVACLSEIFNFSPEKEELQFILSILVSCGDLVRAGSDQSYFIASKNSKSFVEFENYDVNKLKIKALEFLQKYDSQAYGIFRSAQGDS